MSNLSAFKPIHDGHVAYFWEWNVQIIVEIEKFLQYFADIMFGLWL